MATTQSQAFTSSGDFTVPAGVSLVWIMMQGTGGAGTSTQPDGFNNFSAGGGCGALCTNVPVHVAANDVIAIVISASGASTTRYEAGQKSGPTTFGDMSVDGGKGGWWEDTSHLFGGGGGRLPFSQVTINRVGGGGAWTVPDTQFIAAGVNTQAKGATDFFGGTSGGNGRISSSQDGYPGGSNVGYAGGAGGTGTTSPSRNGGAGGGASIFGSGGAGGTSITGSETAGQVGAGYGAGGGGGGTPNLTGGAGATGYVLVYWMA